MRMRLWPWRPSSLHPRSWHSRSWNSWAWRTSASRAWARLRPPHKLPLNADTICVEWPIKEGGLCAYAWTDEAGQSYLCTKSLNRLGQATGLALWVRGAKLEEDMVVGFIDETPLVMRVVVNATPAGLELVVRLPPEIKSGEDFVERRFSPWNSRPPTFSFTLAPTLNSLAEKSFPRA